MDMKEEVKQAMRKPNKKIVYPHRPEAEVVNDKAGNQFRPAYHPGYEGFRCRVYLLRENDAQEPIQISDAQSAYNLVREELSNSDREIMLAILLTGQNNLIGVETICIGSVQSCVFSSGEVFKGALLANAVSIILCHNHPGGSLEASQQDIRMTESMTQAGKLLGIMILDHLIVTHKGFISIINK